MNHIKQLPKLTEEISRPDRKQTARFYHYVHRWRVWAFQQWLKTVDSKYHHQLPEVADHLIGLILMLAHCRMSYDINVSITTIVESGQANTCRDLLKAIRRELSCPILKKVFSIAGDFDIPLPASLFSSRMESRLEAAIPLLLQRQHVPLWLFGDYHQLCIATPSTQFHIQRSSGERYSRGIHYTPSPLVDYLTTSVIDDFMPSVHETNCRILDPSCGCGLFLIAAFRDLVQRMLNQNDLQHNNITRANAIFDILKNNIFGTDIDHRAVEWTQRLLLLAAKQLMDFIKIDSFQSEIVIPDLLGNIRCCNFLTDDVIDKKTFDIVLGGPPFVPFSELKRSAPDFIVEARKQFQVAEKGQFDLYMMFIEKALNLLRYKGRLGFSLSNTFLRSKSGELLRQLIKRASHVDEIIEFSDKKIYPNAAVQIVLLQLTLDRDSRKPTRHVIVNSRVDIRSILNNIYVDHFIPVHSAKVSAYHIGDQEWTPPLPAIINTKQKQGILIGELPIKFFQGMTSRLDRIFLLKDQGTCQNMTLGQSGLDKTVHRFESALIKHVVRGREISGFLPPTSGYVLVYPYLNGQLIYESLLS